MAVVQTVSGANNSTSSPAATLASTTAGNLLTATVSVSLTSGTGTITPPAGWLAGTLAFDGGHRILQQFVYPNNPGGITTVTFTVAGAGLPQTGCGVVLSEISGAPTGLSTYDTTGSGRTTNSSGATSITATAGGATTQSIEFELCGFRNSTSNASEAVSTPTGFTLAGSQPSGVAGVCTFQWFRQTTATETPTATSSWSDSVASGMVIDTWYAPPVVVDTSSAPDFPDVLTGPPIGPPPVQAMLISPPRPVGNQKPPPPPVMIIVLENQDKSYIYGNPLAPMINALCAQFPTFTNMFGTAHPSLPNYLELWSGSSYGIVDDNAPSSHTALQGLPRLGEQLNAAGFNWKMYFQSLSGSPLTDEGTTDSSGDQLYVVHHNPEAYFGSDNLGLMVPWTQAGMVADLNTGPLPQFVWLGLDMMNNMHDPNDGTVATNNTAISAGDTTVGNAIAAIQGTAWYTQLGGTIIVTWDESYLQPTNIEPTTGINGQFGGPVAGLAISQKLATAAPWTNGLDGSRNFSQLLGHAGILRGIQTLYGLPLLNDAQTATYGDITPLLAPVSSQLPTGDIVGVPSMELGPPIEIFPPIGPPPVTARIVGLPMPAGGGPATTANISPPVAAGTGVGVHPPQPAVDVFPGAAPATGVGVTPTVSIVPPTSTSPGTGVGVSPTLTAGVSPTAAPASGVGVTPTATVVVFPGAGVGTGVGVNPSVTTSGNTNVSPLAAPGTGVGATPSVTVGTLPGASAGSGAGSTPTVTVGPAPTAAVASGAGVTPSTTATPVGSTAPASGVGVTPTVVVSVLPLAAAGTGVGVNPSISTTGNTNVSPGAAVATGAGSTPTVAVGTSPTAAPATGAGVAVAITVNIFPAAATGTGVGASPTAGTTVNAAAAAGAGAGTNPGTSLGIYPQPSSASGIGSGPGVTVTVLPAASIATAVGVSPVFGASPPTAAGVGAGVLPTVTTDGRTLPGHATASDSYSASATASDSPQSSVESSDFAAYSASTGDS